MSNYSQLLHERIDNRQKYSLLDVNVHLEDFAIISYSIPINRIIKLIPDNFSLWTFSENEQEYALISAVNFRDTGFHFKKLLRYPKFSFFQTNFRAYVIDNRTGEHCVWFFGTTLGSPVVNIPRFLWKMPWYYAKYKCTTTMNSVIYNNYKVDFSSQFGNGNVHLISTNNEMPLLKGFHSLDEQLYILTHPVTGYYYRKDKKVGTYKIWHPKLELHEGLAKNLYFELFENLGLLNKEEMQNPHSVLISPKIEFDIYLPPKTLK